MMSDEKKMAIYTLLRDQSMLFEPDWFTLTPEDREDGIETVIQKLDDKTSANWENHYGEIHLGSNLITVMEKEEGPREYFSNAISGKDLEDVINLIGWSTNNFREIFEKGWNWKLQDVDDYVLSTSTTMKSGKLTDKLIQFADELDSKGLMQEANVIDNLLGGLK